MVVMSTKSREYLDGSDIRIAAERAAEARKKADQLACVAIRALRSRRDAGRCAESGFAYLEVRRFGCDTHQTASLAIIRRAKTTPIHQLERYMRCKDCSQVHGHPFKRSHLVALRPNKISVLSPPSI